MFRYGCVGKRVSGRRGGRVFNINAIGGPQLIAEAEFDSVQLVSLGKVLQ